MNIDLFSTYSHESAIRHSIAGHKLIAQMPQGTEKQAFQIGDMVRWNMQANRVFQVESFHVDNGHVWYIIRFKKFTFSTRQIDLSSAN